MNDKIDGMADDLDLETGGNKGVEGEVIKGLAAELEFLDWTSVSAIDRMRKRVEFQDNRCTGNPIFCVMDGVGQKDSIFIQPFFTQAAADDYIARNTNLGNPWVYVKSGNFNVEWRAVRHLFGGRD